MNDQDVYYMIYTPSVATEHLLEAGFKQNLTTF